MFTQNGTEIRQDCAKLMILEKQEVQDMQKLIGLSQKATVSPMSRALWCQLIGACVSTHNFELARGDILMGLSSLMASRNVLLVKNAVLTLASLQAKTGMPDFGLSKMEANYVISIRNYFLRTLASAI